MYLRSHELQPAGAPPAPAFGRATPSRPRTAATWPTDLGQRIGSAEWWLGLAGFLALLGVAWFLLTPFAPLPGASTPPLAGAMWEDARTQAIAPLALGATSGGRMAATALVRPLAATPERPSIDTAVTLGAGDTLVEALQRAGVGRGEAGRVADLVATAMPLDRLPPGTTLALTLGRRPTAVQPRPVERLSLRAALDLTLTVTRSGSALSLQRRAIALDRTPLHVSGTAGASLYRSLRAGGVPARLAEAYIRAIAPHTQLGALGTGDTFDLVADQVRAATGEVEVGDLQYAGLEQGRRRLQLVRWGEEAADGGATFRDANRPSTIVRAGAFARPVIGHVTSTFGMRFHPLLGFSRFHKGLDIGAPYGSPIVAVLDGLVSYAGWSGGYGNFVRLAHGGALGTGYGHMSRIAVRQGERVRRGEVIGYVGSSGLSTGPHLHWEVWKNGVAVNPATFSLSTVETTSPATLHAMRAKVARLLATPARS